MELDFLIVIDYEIFLDFILNTKQRFETKPFGIALTRLRTILYCTSYSKQTLWSEGKKLFELLLVFASLF